jgi:hypothetical protein
VRISESKALHSNFINIWGGDFGGTITAEITISKIIGKYTDYVRQWLFAVVLSAGDQRTGGTECISDAVFHIISL